MGGGSTYDVKRRFAKSESATYMAADHRSAATMDSVFTQQKERKAHDSMLSKGVTLRESRDSELHPKTTAIVLAMDVTGSMLGLPAELVKTGLPKIMGKLVEAGCDPALLFTAIGDHEYDRFPLQIGQFESGDDELDMWLTRTFIEGGGGGNGGESYLLAWYLAAYVCQTDAWDKRKEKGFLFTIGDEPNLTSLPASAVKEIFGTNAGEKENYTAKELYDKASEQWNVYHIHINHGLSFSASWTHVMGQKAVQVSSVDDVAKTIVNIIASNMKLKVSENSQVDEDIAKAAATAGKPTEGSVIL